MLQSPGTSDYYGATTLVNGKKPYFYPASDSNKGKPELDARSDLESKASDLINGRTPDGSLGITRHET